MPAVLFHTTERNRIDWQMDSWLYQLVEILGANVHLMYWSRNHSLFQIRGIRIQTELPAAQNMTIKPWPPASYLIFTVVRQEDSLGNSRLGFFIDEAKAGRPSTETVLQYAIILSPLHAMLKIFHWDKVPLTLIFPKLISWNNAFTHGEIISRFISAKVWTNVANECKW